ncbi:hypothetical protein LX36DRAFT_665831 [Colletotrichum falcatum]|nr:hypothetical protein LX36DRAFT_665831 [Colletotrichum falcatum]
MPKPVRNALLQMALVSFTTVVIGYRYTTSVNPSLLGPVLCSTVPLGFLGFKAGAIAPSCENGILPTSPLVERLALSCVSFTRSSHLLWALDIHTPLYVVFLDRIAWSSSYIYLLFKEEFQLYTIH